MSRLCSSHLGVTHYLIAIFVVVESMVIVVVMARVMPMLPSHGMGIAVAVP